MNKELLEIIIKRLSSLSDEEFIQALQITTKNNEIKIKWEYPPVVVTSNYNSPFLYDEKL